VLYSQEAMKVYQKSIKVANLIRYWATPFFVTVHNVDNYEEN